MVNNHNPEIYFPLWVMAQIPTVWEIKGSESAIFGFPWFQPCYFSQNCWGVGKWVIKYHFDFCHTAKILAAKTAVFYSTSISHLLFNGHIGRFLLQQFILHQWPVWDSKPSRLQLKPAKWAGHKTVATTINTNQYDYHWQVGNWRTVKTCHFCCFNGYSLLQLALVLMS